MAHPAHVHLFKHSIRELEKKGHEIRVVSRDKDLSLSLLRENGLDFTCLSRAGKRFGLLLEYPLHLANLLRFCLRWRPDLMVNSPGGFVAPVGILLGIPTVAFSDTEHANLQNLLSFPWVNWVITPSFFRKRLGRKQVIHESSHQLAHLHPKRFTPDISVLKEIGLSEGEPFFVLRFVAWAAAHDSGHHGFSEAGKRRIVHELSKLGKVLITSESPLPEDLKPYQVQVAASRLHSLLSYATLYLGEGATTALEAAVLGTPSIYVSTIWTGATEEMEKRYELLRTTKDEEEALGWALKWAAAPDIQQEWQEKRKRLLQDKQDLTDFFVHWLEKWDASRKTRESL